MGHSRLDRTASSCPQFAPLKHADERPECLLFGVDPKGAADGQSDASSPLRTWLLASCAARDQVCRDLRGRPSSNALANGSCSSVSLTEKCDMPDQETAIPTIRKQTPWNKGKLTGAKPPLRPKHVWSIRTKLQIEGRVQDLAMFNLAIDSKLRGCDVVAIKVDDVAAGGYTADRATVRQKKTGRPVRFELTEQTRQAVR
jgi:hypothetical protein